MNTVRLCVAIALPDGTRDKALSARAALPENFTPCV